MELQAAPTSAAQGRFWPLLRLSFGAHSLLLGLTLAYLAAFLLIDASTPLAGARDGLEVMLSIMLVSAPAVFFALLIYKFIEMAVYENPDRPLKTLWRNFRAVLADRERMAAGLPVFIVLVIFMYVFTMVKSHVPVLAPYAWDVTFDQWDRVLHFGYRPWELLQPVFGFWPVTFLVNLNYNMWFVVMNVFWAYYAFIAKPGEERTRFFISYMMIWIVGGGVLAVVFSSAGPCYYTRIGLSPDPYVPLMDYLRSANEVLPIWALSAQDMLWQLQSEGSAFGGISAMPSMHNATALLFVLTSGDRPLWVRRGLIVHAALIFLGSVHLGWHYAVDGYLAFALAYAVWRAMEPVARWWEQSSAAQNYKTAMRVGG